MEWEDSGEDRAMVAGVVPIRSKMGIARRYQAGWLLIPQEERRRNRNHPVVMHGTYSSFNLGCCRN